MEEKGYDSGDEDDDDEKIDEIDTIKTEIINKPVEFVKKVESSANVSSAIMIKVPTYSLASIRQDFERESEGLDLTQFLKTFVANMDLEDEEELISTVPDLVGID
jgi:hypothetical protein